MPFIMVFWCWFCPESISVCYCFLGKSLAFTICTSCCDSLWIHKWNHFTLQWKYYLAVHFYQNYRHWYLLSVCSVFAVASTFLLTNKHFVIFKANRVTANNCHHHKYRVGLFWSLWFDWKILAQSKHSHSSVWKGSMTPYIQLPCLSWTLQNMKGPSCSTIDDSHPLKVTHCCTIFSAEKWATWKGLGEHVRATHLDKAMIHNPRPDQTQCEDTLSPANASMPLTFISLGLLILHYKNYPTNCWKQNPLQILKPHFEENIQHYDCLAMKVVYMSS